MLFCFIFVIDLAGRPKELYEEALTINKECNGSITLSDIQKMKKLDSFIKESLRHTDDIRKDNLMFITYNYINTCNI